MFLKICFFSIERSLQLKSATLSNYSLLVTNQPNQSTSLYLLDGRAIDSKV